VTGAVGGSFVDAGTPPDPHSTPRVPFDLKANTPPCTSGRCCCRICLYGIKAPPAAARLHARVIMPPGRDGPGRADNADPKAQSAGLLGGRRGGLERAGWQEKEGETGGGAAPRAAATEERAAWHRGCVPASPPAPPRNLITDADDGTTTGGVDPTQPVQSAAHLPDLPLTAPGGIVHGAPAASRAARGRGPLAPTATVAPRCPSGTLDPTTAPRFLAGCEGEGGDQVQHHHDSRACCPRAVRRGQPRSPRARSGRGQPQVRRLRGTR